MKAQVKKVIGSLHVKSANPPHLTHMDFADTLLSQYTHQEMKILKILSSYHERFQNYDCLNYEPLAWTRNIVIYGILKLFLFSQF